MATNDDAKRLNDKRMHAHQAARMILARAAVDGRPLRAEEKAAIARADEIVAETQSVRDALVRRDQALRDLDGVRDEFRGTNEFPDIEGEEELRAFTSGQVMQFDIDLAPAARAFQAFRAGMRGLELRAFTGDASSASGGSLTLPTDVALNVYSTMTQASAMRQTRATVIVTSGGAQMRFPRIVTHGIGTQIAGQTTSFGGTDPVLGQMILDAYDVGQSIPIANDLLEDGGIDVLAWIAQEAGRAVGVTTDTMYVVGDGNGKPQGIVTAGGTGIGGTVATGGSLLYGPTGGVADKLTDFVFSVDSGYRQRGEWLMNDLTAHALRNVRSDSGGTSGHWIYQMSPTASLPGGTPDTLHNYPVHIDANVASLASSATIAVFGDLSAYYIRDVRGLSITRSDQHKFDLNQTVIRALLRTDGDLIDKTAVNVLRAVVA